jgi:hypothetical protein
MKFYRDKYDNDFWYKIINNKLTSINCTYSSFAFFKNGLFHNTKNVAYIRYGWKTFHLNGDYYGNNKDFTKQTWRKFSKLKAFL